VSPVSARVSRPIAPRSPATTRVAGTWLRPNGCASAPIRSSSSWSSWPVASPKNAVRCPDTCTAWSGTRVPEKTRTRLSRPTYGSLGVLTTSATSAPPASLGLGPDGAAAGPRRGDRGLEHLGRGVLGRRRERADGEAQQLRAADARRGADRNHREER